MSAASSSSSSSSSSASAGLGLARKAEEEAEDKSAKRRKLDPPQVWSCERRRDLRELLLSLRKSPLLIPYSQPVLSDLYKVNKVSFVHEISASLVSRRIDSPQILYALLYHAGCFEDGDINSPICQYNGTVLHLVVRHTGYYMAPFFEFFCEKGADVLQEDHTGLCAAEKAGQFFDSGPTKNELMRIVYRASRGNPEAMKYFRTKGFDREFLHEWVFQYGQDFTLLREREWENLVKDIIEHTGDDFMFWINCYIQCGAISRLMGASVRAPSVSAFKLEYNAYRMVLSERGSLVHAQLSRVKEFHIPLRKLVLDYLGVVTLLSDESTFSVASIEVSNDTDPFNPVYVYESMNRVYVYDSINRPADDD